MDERLTFFTIQAMINQIDNIYFIFTSQNFFASLEQISFLIQKREPLLYSHLSKMNLKLSHIVHTVWTNLLFPSCEIPASFTLFDSFVSEGRKVYVRFLLAFFTKEKYHFLNCNNQDEFSSQISSSLSKFANLSYVQSIIKIGFAIHLAYQTHLAKPEERISKSLGAVPSFLFPPKPSPCTLR